MQCAHVSSRFVDSYRVGLSSGSWDMRQTADQDSPEDLLKYSTWTISCMAQVQFATSWSLSLLSGCNKYIESDTVVLSINYLMH
jgi:hypothetical protein